MVDDSTKSEWDRFNEWLGSVFSEIGNGLSSVWDVLKWILLAVTGLVFIVFVVYVVKFFSSLFKSNSVKIKISDQDKKRKSDLE